MTPSGRVFLWNPLHSVMMSTRMKGEEMKTKWIILGVAVILCAGMGYVAVHATCGDGASCTGTANCIEEMRDECTTEQGLGGFHCTGGCWRSSVSGTVSACRWALWGNCPYNGAEACEGIIERRDCATGSLGSLGEECSGGCTGDWSVAYENGVIVNCT
jgi:hypothetical protein